MGFKFDWLPLRPYIAVYPWVDQNWVPIKYLIVSSDKGSEIKVPIKY